MKISDLIEALGSEVVSVHGATDVEITGATADSREVGQGMLFCASKGERFDGADYVPQAVARGCAAVVWGRGGTLSVPAIQVRDALRVQGIVAECAAGRPAAKMRMIGVTGTNGKTTTTWLLREMFREAGVRAGLVGTVLYDVGDGHEIPGDRTTPVAFELQKLFRRCADNGLRNVVMEVSSHALEQRRLGTTQCGVAVFTNLTEDHLDYHRTMENYYRAKRLLFERHLAEGGVAVLNGDDEWCRRLAKELPSNRSALLFSLEDSPADVKVADVRLAAEGSSFALKFASGEIWRLRTPLPGEYNVRNAVCAVLAAQAAGLSREAIAAALARCKGAPGRMERVDLPKAEFSVFVDYAHTDDALRNALRMLRGVCAGRIVAVFGCGGNRDRRKRPLMARAVAEFADVIVVTTDNPRMEEPEAILREIETGFPDGTRYESICDRGEAIARALSIARAGDVVLIAGKGHEDYQEVRGVKHHFSDRETVRELWGKAR